MANKYIDADELLNEVLGTMFSMSMCLSEQAWRGMKHAQQIFARMIETAPAADVVEVKRGRWIEREDMYYGWNIWECSLCREEFCVEEGTPKDNEYNYCPNCGAKMEVEE